MATIATSLRSSCLRIALGLALLSSLAGCRRSEQAKPHPRPSRRASDRALERGLLALDGEAVAALSMRRIPPARTRSRLAELTRAVRTRLSAGLPPWRALNVTVFGDGRLVREVEDQGVRTALLPRVLSRRRGSCLGLGTLYLVLGERLGLPLSGVLLPDHFFVRFDDGSIQRDIELLERGEQMKRSWYRARYRLPHDSRLYLRPLRSAEVLAVVRFNLANELRRRGLSGAAIAAYREVVTALPAFGPAHANLGLTYQLRGASAQAERAYRHAAQVDPGLPGVRKNLAALRER